MGLIAYMSSISVDIPRGREDPSVSMRAPLSKNYIACSRDNDWRTIWNALKE